MRHLNDSEYVDALDGRLAPDRIRHAETCSTCLARVDDLRGLLTDAASDPLPDPSPLFWEHFSARVSGAIRQEPPHVPVGPMWLEWLRHPISMWAGAAAVTILMIATVVWRATLHAPSGPYFSSHTTRSAERGSVTAPADAAGDADAALAADDDPDADEAWVLVRSAADGLGWDEVDAAGISARPGSAERVALEMTTEERAELVRLLESELRRSGA